jgi:hypothetical protein
MNIKLKINNRATVRNKKNYLLDFESFLNKNLPPNLNYLELNYRRENLTLFCDYQIEDEKKGLK